MRMNTEGKLFLLSCRSRSYPKLPTLPLTSLPLNILRDLPLGKGLLLGLYFFAQYVWKLKFLTFSLGYPSRVQEFLNPSGARDGQRGGKKKHSDELLLSHR